MNILILIIIIGVLSTVGYFYAREKRNCEDLRLRFFQLESKYQQLQEQYWESEFVNQHGMTRAEFDQALWDKCLKNNQPII